MKKIEVIAKSGCSFSLQGKIITDQKYQVIEKGFGIRRLLKNGSLIEKAATVKTATSEKTATATEKTAAKTKNKEA